MSAIILSLPCRPRRAIVVEPVHPGRTWRWVVRVPHGPPLGDMSEVGDRFLVVDSAHDWSRHHGLPVMLLGVNGALSGLRRISCGGQ